MIPFCRTNLNLMFIPGRCVNSKILFDQLHDFIDFDSIFG